MTGWRRFLRRKSQPESEQETEGLVTLPGQEVLGVILAGGQSRRMDADKALVKVGGVPMAERVVEALRPFGEVLVVGRSTTLAGVAGVPDYPEAKGGPLSGLVTALRAASDLAPAGSQPLVLLVAVDQPFVRIDTLRWLLAFAGSRQAVVPVDGGARQVTCAVYPVSFLREAELEDKRNGSIQSLLDRMPMREIREEEWQRWGEDGRSWFSVDTPDKIAEGEERFL